MAVPLEPRSRRGWRSAGRRILLLEKEHFPRFHIGESLLPCSMPLIEQLGAMPRLKAADFLPKYAAEFVTADGSLKRPLRLPRRHRARRAFRL